MYINEANVLAIFSTLMTFQDYIVAFIAFYLHELIYYFDPRNKNITQS